MFLLVYSAKKSYRRQAQFSKTIETQRKEMEKNIMITKILSLVNN